MGGGVKSIAAFFGEVWKVMNEEKRYADTYEIIQCIRFGTNEFVIGEDRNNKELPYMTARYEWSDVFAQYYDVVGSDNYIEIMSIFAHRIADEADRIQKEVDDMEAQGFGMEVISKEHCTLISHKDNINGKVIVIDPLVLKREYRNAAHQLKLCTGGFGASANSRGSAVFCTDLRSGKTSRFDRRDVLGIVDVEMLPKWAKEGYDKAIAKEKAAASRDERWKKWGGAKCMKK